MNAPSGLLVTLLLASTGLAKKIPEYLVPGRCPSVPEERLWAALKPHRYRLGGTWYQHSLTPNTFQPLDSCVRMNYEYRGNSFQIKSNGLDKNGALMTTQGQIYPDNTEETRYMIAHEHTTPAPLVVLKTDYSHYACIYSCQEFGGSYYTDYSFIFTRSPQPDASYVSACLAAFKDIGVESSSFIKTPQGENCLMDVLEKINP